MSVIYRPHRGSLSEAMKDVIEFDTFQDLQKYIIKEMESSIKLRECDIVPGGRPVNDDRIGWKDSDYLCIDGYDKVRDKEGYKLCFGDSYEYPQCIGMFATDYKDH
ncbi:hypothetical protein LXJ15735_27740 [Lacrimispora xylanolytica]